MGTYPFLWKGKKYIATGQAEKSSGEITGEKLETAKWVSQKAVPAHVVSNTNNLEKGEQ